MGADNGLDAHHAAPRCLLRLHDRASEASEAGERDWTIRFKRTWNALPPHGIGPFRATADEPTRRIFCELEGLDNPPWWMEWKRR